MGKLILSFLQKRLFINKSLFINRNVEIRNAGIRNKNENRNTEICETQTKLTIVTTETTKQMITVVLT